MPDEIFGLDAASLAKLKRMAAWFETFNGPGVTNSPFGPSSAAQRGASPFNARSPIRWFGIDSSSATATVDANGNAVKWTYTVTEKYKATAGYGGWSTKTGGYTGTAYNSAEEGNDGSGRQMNGVDHDGTDYPATVQMYPLQNGAVIPGVLIYTATGTAEVWLMPFGLGEDGTCS